MDALRELIYHVLIGPVFSAVEPLRGQWSSLGKATAGFFWLFFLVAVPGLVMAAPVAFGFEGLAAGRVATRGRRLLVSAGGGMVYAFLPGVMEFVGTLGAHSDEAIGILLAPLVYLLPTALGVFGFWLPTIACGAYATLAKRPKWWLSAPIGTVTLILGVWLWILLGTLVGAGVD